MWVGSGEMGGCRRDTMPDTLGSPPKGYLAPQRRRWAGGRRTASKEGCGAPAPKPRARPWCRMVLGAGAGVAAAPRRGCRGGSGWVGSAASVTGPKAGLRYALARVLLRGLLFMMAYSVSVSVSLCIHQPRAPIRVVPPELGVARTPERCSIERTVTRRQSAVHFTDRNNTDLCHWGRTQFMGLPRGGGRRLTSRSAERGDGAPRTRKRRQPAAI